MLGSRNKTDQKTDPRNNPGSFAEAASTCVISSGTELEGIFTSKENVRLDGKVKGEVKCDSRLVMGETGKVEGKLQVGEAVIMGTIEGDLVVHGSLTLKSSARIKGNITAKLMAVEEGAVYNGECKIGSSAGKS
ncbi:MAG TPA: polymer-forming cytoskeletal protein [Saprospiraceae bacterium]|nr:polymer-forming cytoskeletal protein [Saprospiraceae bacterium]